MGNEFMNLSINANGFSNVQNTAAGHKAEQANKQGKSAFFAGSPVLTTKNQIEQRKKMAQKSALKLVKDAWDNDQAVEKTVASQRQRYAELDAQRTEAKKALAGYEDQEKTLKEQCNVADDSKEQQDLNLLEKRQEYRRGVGEKLTRDEWKKLCSFNDILIAGPKYKQLCNKALHLEELQEYPFISLVEGTGTHDHYTKFFYDNDLHFNLDMEASTTDQVLAMVQSNLGLGFYPEQLASEYIMRGEIFPVSLHESVPERDIILIRESRHAENIAAKKLINFLKHTTN